MKFSWEEFTTFELIGLFRCRQSSGSWHPGLQEINCLGDVENVPGKLTSNLFVTYQVAENVILHLHC